MKTIDQMPVVQDSAQSLLAQQFADLVCQGLAEYEIAIRPIIHELATRLLLSTFAQHSCLPQAECDARYLQPDVLNCSALIAANSPICYENHRFYLRRYALYERAVADTFSKLVNTPISVDIDALKQILNQYFATQVEVDWQKLAVAAAMTRPLAVITGGPGTGKTTTVTKLLAVLQHYQLVTEQRLLRIQLVAPTGKAAMRLSESIKQAKQRMSLLPAVAQAIPEQASTLHRALRFHMQTGEFLHNANNPLHCDVLVIDEASMIDLAMFYRLLTALNATTRVVILGDEEQLASVELGQCLTDICLPLKSAVPSWSSARCQEVAAITGQRISPVGSSNAITDCIVKLLKSHRFSEQSGIGQLAKAIQRQDGQACGDCFNQFTEQLQWWDSDLTSVNQVVQHAIAQYQPYWSLAQQGAAPEQVHHVFNQFRVLAAVKAGKQGVDTLNLQIERGLISSQSSGWYCGKAIMVSQNDYGLDLYNGDIGITLYVQGRLQVSFLSADGQVRLFNPARLPKHELAYVMTVHKSQGSEFDEVLMVLPNNAPKAVSQTLLYTAVTRAKQKFACFANVFSFNAALNHQQPRASGLGSRLYTD